MYGFVILFSAFLYATTEQDDVFTPPSTRSSSTTSSIGPESDDDEVDDPFRLASIDKNTYVGRIGPAEEGIYCVMKRIDGRNYHHWRNYAETKALVWLDHVLSQGLITETWVVYRIKGDPQSGRETGVMQAQAGSPERLIDVGVFVNFPEELLALSLFLDNEKGAALHDIAVSTLQRRIKHMDSAGIIDSKNRTGAMFFKCCSVVDRLRLADNGDCRCRVLRMDGPAAQSKTVSRLRNAILMAS